MKVKAKVDKKEKPSKIRIKGYEKLMAKGKCILSKSELIDITDVLNYKNDNVNISKVSIDGIITYELTQ